MGLFGLFNKPKHTNSIRPNLDRLDPNGDLPWGWIYANKEFTEKIEGESRYFLEAFLNAKKEGALKQYAALKSYILYLDDAKKLCDSKGECFQKWYSDIIASPNYYKKLIDDLKDLETNMDALLKKEKWMQDIEKNVLPNLKAELFSIIESEPGIFQVDLFKRYSADLKPFIHTELYKLELEGLLLKEKEGRRNRLFIKPKGKGE